MGIRESLRLSTVSNFKDLWISVFSCPFLMCLNDLLVAFSSCWSTGRHSQQGEGSRRGLLGALSNFAKSCWQLYSSDQTFASSFYARLWSLEYKGYKIWLDIKVYRSMFNLWETRIQTGEGSTQGSAILSQQIFFYLKRLNIFKWSTSQT